MSELAIHLAPPLPVYLPDGLSPLQPPAPLLGAADVETDGWPNGTVPQLAASTSRFLVTRGKDGADEHRGAELRRVPVFQVCHAALVGLCYVQWVAARLHKGATACCAAPVSTP